MEIIENYQKYLNVIQEKIDYFFSCQNEYIFCKAGCAKCCKNAQFPFSEIEFKYLIIGFNLLPHETKYKIRENINKILEQKKIFEGKVFTYDCPFLIEDSCSCYKNRGIVCRTFGLLSQGADDKNPQMPFCILEGLNYSNVYDKEKNCLSTPKFEQSGISTPPYIYNIDYKTLLDPEFERGFGFKFGKVKPLIEWFEQSPSSLQELNPLP